MLMLGVLLLFLMPLSATGTAELCGSNYTTNSTYQSNLAVLAATLPTNASSSLQQFAAATVGQAPDAVHALALCRGDFANDTACADCVAASFQGAQQTCPNDEAATVYYDYDDVNNQRPGCVLGFSGDSDFLSPAAGLTENGTLFEAWNPGNISADATITAADVHKLLTVTAQDSAADTARRYSTAVMDAVPTLYSLAQCTPDLSAGDCLVCLQRLIGMVNATTSVRQGGRIFVLRCNIRFETFMFFDQPMRRINPSSITQAPPTGKNTGIKRWIIAICVSSAVALAAFCFMVYCRCLRGRIRKRGLRERRTNKLHGGDHELVWDMETGMLSGFSFFEFDQIQEATGNFSEENKLGEGGFGPVYKGHFVQGMEIAVKRLASHSGQGLVEFKNEVQLIAKLQHRNLVRLLGCCSQGEEKILVYEYMPNKSLDFFIFDERRKVLMDWNRRLSIIEGIAEGLLYLHKHSRLRVIHRDLKPSNILLDNEMNPKISDFGLAKIFSPNNNEENSTRRVVGTYGYMAPEYASEGLFSIKSDVFSFGVLVLEILSGKRNSGSHQCGDFINLLGYAWQLWEDRRWIDIVDASLNSFLPKTHPTEIMRCINIALLCVQENAVDRPNMLDVTTMLSSKTMILREPKHPPYFNLRVGNEEDTSATQSCSINGVTLSIATAR
ncbi:cysteine-rich receptor-like protein kinase 10 isoform X1 [Aegilops tauschii subsp. strangulata]|uniref:cysteine-rich receptor-like protein kinase 10 isoform X1 n=1 Tax=Aegilops tauschii subsp. strangulata TaxID=200361 RepID=UPI001ABCC32C|nr:cysteine-rich receptor-like protein kinase 10 isoform X1 [Aegilops tauschii subsp. strangulata]